MTARWFDFSLADVKPNSAPRTVWTDLDLKVGDAAFQILGLEAKPRNGLMWKVKRTERQF